jgi:hypothetical protein
MNGILARKCEGDIFIVDNDKAFVINLQTNIRMFPFGWTTAYELFKKEAL